MVPEIRQPMLSGKPDDNKGGIPGMLRDMRWPKLASPKMDGIRAFVNHNYSLRTRSLKTIPNRYTQELFSREALAGFDGELAAGKPYDFNLMQQTTSATSTITGKPLVHHYIFDDMSMGLTVPFEKRLGSAERRCKEMGKIVPVKFVPHVLIENLDDLLAYEDKCLKQGYEGVMLRDPKGMYKAGRSTLIEGGLIALKRFEDFEATIKSIEEMVRNDNVATTDERGYTKRSSHKANFSGKGTLGTILCETKDGVEFHVGGGKGLTAEMRDYLWSIRHRLPGATIKCESQPIGTKERPRMPRMRAKEANFIALRPDFDL